MIGDRFAPTAPGSDRGDCWSEGNKMKVDLTGAVIRLADSKNGLWVSNSNQGRMVHHGTAGKLIEMGWAYREMSVINRDRILITEAGKEAAKNG